MSGLTEFFVSPLFLLPVTDSTKRLKEAKDLLPHGECGKWLKESVSYSQRTAERLMQLCEEYVTKLLASPDSEGHPGAHPSWDPGRGAAGVIAEHDVESMTNSAEQEKVTLKQRELEAAKEEVPSARKIAKLEKRLKTVETKSSLMTASFYSCEKLSIAVD